MLEKCLVVDDHEMIRETIAIMAKSLGFKEAVMAIDARMPSQSSITNGLHDYHRFTDGTH